MRIRQELAHLRDDDGNAGRRKPLQGPVTGAHYLTDETGRVDVHEDDAAHMIASGGWRVDEPPK